MARPATRADEMFNAMMWWAPLSDPLDVDPLLRGIDVVRRARILADAYDLSGTHRSGSRRSPYCAPGGPGT